MLYRNDSGLYEYEEFLDKRSDWFEDEEGNLYIVPWHEEYEIEGPDTEEADVLRRVRALKAKRELPARGKTDVFVVARDLGLHYVAYSLHRFSSTEGYYHA